jgi:hypothetical protein
MQAVMRRRAYGSAPEISTIQSSYELEQAAGS